MSERGVLFVDDDQAVLDALRAQLGQEPGWRSVYVGDAKTALVSLAAEPFDVIVADIRMPGMDGIELLDAVRAQFPSVARVALSGRSDRESVGLALTVAQQFLSKPCSGQTLRGQINRVCDLQNRVRDDAVRRVVGGLTRLPSPPSVYLQLTQAVTRPDIGLAQLADIVECDPVISAKVLQIVNSAYFGLAQRISSIHQAVLYLGVDLLKSLALYAHVFTKEQTAQLEGFSMNALQTQSLLAAHLANRLVEDQGHGDEAYSAALIHDIGQIVLAVGMPQKFAEALRTARFRKQPAHVIQLEVIGATHAEVGAYLLGQWGLPFSTVEAVANQHTPSRVKTGSREVLAATHLSDALVKAAAAREDEATLMQRLDLQFLAEVGLDADIPTWYSLAREELNPSNRGPRR